MPETLTIAVDAMGGDHAPDEIVRGACLVSLESPHIHSILVGDTARITSILAATRHNAERISVQHAPEAIGMEESPREALEAKPQASIVVAARLVAQGKARALVSAGSTGASVLVCSREWKRLEGVRRAALAAVYPTEIRRGEKDDPFSLILDVGATTEVEPIDLVTFAIMGSAYASKISRNPRPRVALLSNGTEALKGPPTVVEAHKILKEQSGLNFVGNVEGVDIPKGTADVVVCSGFVGNVVLKMLEGVSETVVRLARYAYKERLLWRLGLMMLSGGITRVKEVTDWEQYGGAPLLGLDHLYIKAHGRSKARAVANAVKVAAKAEAGGLGADITAQLAALREGRATA